MTRQQSGWQRRAIHNAYNARAKRNKEIARLRASRVYDEWTSSDLLAIQRDLKADFTARDAARRTP